MSWYAGCTISYARITGDRLQVANAGVNEIGDYTTPKVKDGKLEKPVVSTIDINLMGTIYSKYDPINGICDNRFICMLIS